MQPRDEGDIIDTLRCRAGHTSLVERSIQQDVAGRVGQAESGATPGRDFGACRMRFKSDVTSSKLTHATRLPVRLYFPG